MSHLSMFASHLSALAKHLSAFVLQLMNPRGRCSRTGMLLATVLLLGLQAAVAALLWVFGASFTGKVAQILSIPFCWLAISVVCKRLHDMGRSAWLVPTAVLIWLAGAVVLAVSVALIGEPEFLAPGSLGYWITFGVMLVPLLIAALWLHVAEGDAIENRHGPVPSALGFAMPNRAAWWQRSSSGARPSAA